jgi:hypothetical protein
MDSPTRLRPLLAQHKVPPATFTFRAAFATAHAHVTRDRPPTPADVRDLFGDDDVVTPLLIQKSTTLPATTQASGWAAELAAGSILDLLVGIAPASAAARLFTLSTPVIFPEGIATVGVPGVTLTSFSGGGFVKEADPIPTRQYLIEGSNLTLRKVACIVELTEELAMYSNFEPIVRQLITRGLGLTLDSKLFGAQADDGNTPGGLLNGNTAITATAGGGQQAVSKDVANLVGALNAAGGGNQIVFVAAPPQAASLRVWASQAFSDAYPILASAALPNGTVLAIEASSLIAGISPIPEFSISSAYVMHEEDTTMRQIGQDATATSPARSGFQTRTLALRMITRISWLMRAVGHVQRVTSVTW